MAEMAGDDCDRGVCGLRGGESGRRAFVEGEEDKF